MQSYSTTYNTLGGLADQEAAATKATGRDLSKWGIIRLDNVQNYLLQRDMRIGREHTMNIGIAATYIEANHFIPSAADIDDKRRRITANRRRDVKVSHLIDWIDQEHIETIGVLQWLQTLVRYVPELVEYKKHVSMLYRTRAAKQRLPVHASRVHPLATSGRNETVSTELKDALLDFLEQTGQTRENYQQRLHVVGGDGLTYEKVLQLKKYLQFHTNEFESFELIEPVLEWWHTMWTDLSRVFETHWGDLLSKDPSTLGHSANKIGRTAPPNLKKVDYYLSVQLAYLVLDVRMLDCWRWVMPEPI